MYVLYNPKLYCTPDPYEGALRVDLLQSLFLLSLTSLFSVFCFLFLLPPFVLPFLFPSLLFFVLVFGPNANC